MFKKTYKKLKVELFYLRKMIRRRVPIEEYFNYYKNKFFGHRLVRRIPKWSCERIDRDFEIHVLSQRSMLWPMVVSLRSFLYHSGLCPQIIVHVETEFDTKTIELLESKFDNVKVISWAEATALIERRTDVSDKIKKYRFGKNPLILKLIDGYLLARAKKIMVLGTDVMFYGKPREIVDFVEGRSEFEAWGTFDTNPPPMMINENYAKKYDVYAKQAEHLNSDLLIFRHDLITKDKFEEYFDNVLDPENYFVDMTGFAVLLTNLKFSFFPYERYHIKGAVGPNTVIKHFTGPRRDELYSYGIDLARERILP